MKIFVVVGGPNGSGKTTLTERNEKKDGITYLNPDEIQKQIATGNTEADIVKAGRLTLEKANDLLEKGESILIESTLSGKAHLKLLKKAKDLGYKTRIDFVCLQSAALNVKRVSDRVKNGGHNVPKTDIKRRYKKALEILPKYLKLADSFRLYDNTVTHTKVLHIIKGKRKDKIVTLSKKLPKWTEKSVEDLNILKRALGKKDFTKSF